MRVPLLGKLFSTKSKDIFRTELIVTMRPRVIVDEREMRQVTDELRKRMISAAEYEDEVKATR